MSDEPEFVGLEDGWTVADERWYNEQASSNGAAPSPSALELEPVSVDGLEAFIGVEEVAEEALLGGRGEPILPQNGLVLMYGDGGAGKTTLTLDAVFHLAGARNWLGMPVERPVRSLVVENEGPRAFWRRMLRTKFEAFGDAGVRDNLYFLAEPWSRFTLGSLDHRVAIAEEVDRVEADLLVLGPLATVGMVGGGTPDEISRFEGLLRDVRARVGRPLAFWIVHHENKSGDVSGAWERVPDTLVHVQGAGNGHTRFVFRKARWSSERHGTTLNLAWSEGRTFDVVEDVARDLYAETLEAFGTDDQWRTYKETAELVKCRPGEAKSVLAELTRRGDLMFEVGPAGRRSNAQCWRLRSATILSLVPDAPEAPSPEPPTDFEF